MKNEHHFDFTSSDIIVEHNFATLLLETTV